MSAPPDLTICCAVNTPPARVAAAFAPLASLDAEIVLAVDDRVDSGWVDGYREIADRVVLVPFPGNFATAPSCRLAAQRRGALMCPGVTTPWPRSIECHQKGTASPSPASAAAVREA